MRWSSSRWDSLWRSGKSCSQFCLTDDTLANLLLALSQLLVLISTFVLLDFLFLVALIDSCIAPTIICSSLFIPLMLLCHGNLYLSFLRFLSYLVLSRLLFDCDQSVVGHDLRFRFQGRLWRSLSERHRLLPPVGRRTENLAWNHPCC